MYVVNFSAPEDALTPFWPEAKPDEGWRTELAVRLGKHADLSDLTFAAHEHDTRTDDFLDSQSRQLTFCSTRVTAAVQDAGLTGIAFAPVTIQLPSGVELTGYHAMQILGRCGPLLQLDPKAKRGQGRGIEAGLYDGSDFATQAYHKGAYPLVVSERAKEVLASFPTQTLEFVAITVQESEG